MSKKALVTGGNRGIGRAICEGLIAAGMDVTAGVRRSEDGPEVAESLGCGWVALDVADDASRRAAMASLDGVDVLINNAGVFSRVSLLDDADEFSRAMSIMVEGPLELIRLNLPYWRKTGWGRIVNISSDMGCFEQGLVGPGAYGVAKASLNALTKVLPRDLPEGVTVNAMAPGWTQTRMGGDNAARSIAEGADTAIWLATLPDGGPTGSNFRDRKPLGW